MGFGPEPVPFDKAGELAREACRRGAVQHELELEQLVRFLLGRRRPRAVLEIGVYHGGTFWLWRRLVHPDGFVVGVDVLEWPACDECEHRRAHTGCHRRTLQHNRNDFGAGEATGTILVGDSRGRGMVDRARAVFEAAGAPGYDLLHIDGDHGPAVRRDLELYAPLVTPDGVIVLHDVELEPAGIGWGPADVWEELRGAPGAFTINRQPDGYGIGVLVGDEWRRWGA